MADEKQKVEKVAEEVVSGGERETVTPADSCARDSEPGSSTLPNDGGSEETPANDDDNEVLYEAELELTALEKYGATAHKISAIVALITIMGVVLFILSFPFSLFLVLFCFDTKRSCLPCQSVRDSPWRLYLTRKSLHYHLPNPPHRPYINVLFCLKRTYHLSIPLQHIQSVAVKVERPEGDGDRSDSITSSRLENILVELKADSPGVGVPVAANLGVWSRRLTVHTLVIYSVKDAGAFVERVQQCLN